MRNRIATAAIVAALAWPVAAWAGGRYDDDRHDDDRYDDDRRDRDRDDRRGDRHDHDDGWSDWHDDGYHDEYGYDDYGWDDGHHGGDGHGDRCPDSFDVVIAVADRDHRDDRGHHGVVCCKVVHHGWQKALVCVDPDDGHGGRGDGPY